MAGPFSLKSLRGAKPHERASSALYAAAVAAARDPYLYETLGVPDTLDGRFDLLSLYAFLLIRRLQDGSEPGKALAQAVFDAMFRDMDDNLREIGVSDLSVGKRMRAMWEAFHGRAKVYGDAMQACDVSALEDALARNVWRSAPPDGSVARLARLVLAQAAHLADQPFSVLSCGQVRFLSAEEAAG